MKLTQGIRSLLLIGTLSGTVTTRARIKPCREVRLRQTAGQPPNIQMVKKEIHHYFESHEYEKEVKQVADRIIAHLRTYDHGQGKNVCYAVVFDIDDTILSSWPFHRAHNFCFTMEEYRQWELQSDAPAILPMQSVYDFALAKGFTIFIVTGRRHLEHEATVKNLHKAGFSGWRSIFYIKEDSACTRESRIVYKSSARRKITKDGFTIIATIGDQESDLLGGYSGAIFKLPNPLYIIP